MTLLGVKGVREIRLKWRSFLAVACLTAAACALLVGFTFAHSDLELSTEAVYERLNFLDLYCGVDPVPRSVLDRVERLPEVAATELRHSTKARIYHEGFPRDYKAKVLSIPTRKEPLLNRLVIHQGSGLYSYRGEVLLEKRFARAKGLQLGDLVSLRNGQNLVRLRLVGLVSSPEYLWLTDNPLDPRPKMGRFAVAFASEHDVRILMGGAPKNELHVQLRDGFDRKRAAERVDQALGSWNRRPPLPRELQASYRSLARDLRAFATLAILCPIFFLAFGTAGLLSALWQLVRQQRRQIGVMLSQGVPRRDILRHYCAIGVCVGGTGTVVGVLLGLVLARLLLHLYVETLGLPFIENGFHLGWLCLALGTGGGVSFLASYIAAASVLRLQPVEALSERAPAYTRTAGWLARLPFGWKMAMRGMIRHPWRSATAFLGGALAVILVTMVLVLLDSQRFTLDFFFTKVHCYQLEVGLKGSPSSSELPPIESWKGVLEVQPLLRRSALVNSVDASVWGLPGESPLLRSYDNDFEVVHFKSGEARVGPVTGQRLGVAPGNRAKVSLFGPELFTSDQSYDVGEMLYEPLAFPVKVSLGDLQRHSERTYGGPHDSVSGLLIRTTPESLETIARRLDALAEVRRVEVKSEQRQDIYDYLKMFDSYKLALLVLAGSLGFMLLSATTTLNIMERRRELATLLCLGVPRRVMMGWLMQELTCIWFVSLLVGIPLGVGAGDLLVNSYESELLQLRLFLSPWTLAQVGAASLLLILASGARAAKLLFELPPVQSAARQD